MAAVGGSIQELDIGGRNFAVASDADAKRKLGGFENEIQSNGNGTARVIKTRVPWSLADISVEVDDSKGDLEYLQAIANSNATVQIAITFVSGLVYQADGTITGEIASSSQNATASISLGGGGEMTKQ
jgi:hypothetical protein